MTNPAITGSFLNNMTWTNSNHWQLEGVYGYNYEVLKPCPFASAISQAITNSYTFEIQINPDSFN